MCYIHTCIGVVTCSVASAGLLSEELSVVLLLGVALFRLNQVRGLVLLTLFGLLLVLRAHLVVFLGFILPINLNGGVHDVLVLDLAQIHLLGSEDGAWPRDSVPSDEGLSGNLVVLHGINSNEGSSAAETSLAVNSNGAGTGFGEVFLATGDEPVDDLLWRHRTVNEDQILVLNTTVDEGTRVVLRVVEAHNLRHIEVLENVHVAARRVTVSLLLTGDAVYWTHEGEELAWNNPVKVTVLDLFVVFVLLDVEL